MRNTISTRGLEVWFATGSQNLYGEETLKQVAKHSALLAKTLNDAEAIPVKIVFKPVLKSTEEIYNLVIDANSNELHWYHHVDAHFFSCKNVDQWTKDLTETFAAFTYAIQPRYSMGRH